MASRRMSTGAEPHAPFLGRRPSKPFTGLPSDKSVHKARPIPRSSRKVEIQTSQAPRIRWAGRKVPDRKVEPPPAKAAYRPPHDGEITSHEERHGIADMVLDSKPFRGSTMSKHRLVEAMHPNATLGLAAPHITQSDHYKHYQEVIYSQGEKGVPGVYFICQGQVKLSRKSEQTLMDEMQRKLFVVGAFTGMSDDENNALRKPKSSEKEWDLVTLGPGDFFGLGGLREAHHVDTARTLWFSNIIFIPMEILQTKLHDVKEAVLQHLEASALSRERQFARITALFEPGAKQEKQEEKEPVRLSIEWGGKKKLDTGVSHVIAPVAKAEYEKRYFRSRSSDVAYAGPYGFRPGEVPQLNPELVAAPTDRTAFHFLNTKETFSRAKEPGSGPDLRLPPKSELPGTRVGRLYYRLWENCTADTFGVLQRMQGVGEESAVTPADSLSSPRPGDQQTEEMLAGEAAQQQRTSNVPSLDLTQAALPIQDPWPSVSERPVTEPGRSRSARYRAEGGGGDSDRMHATVITLSLKEKKRPMTSRPAMGSGITSAFLPSNFKFDAPRKRGTTAVRRTLAWDKMQADGPRVDYVGRAPMSSRKELKIARTNSAGTPRASRTTSTGTPC